jgi:hypothetical protein
MFKYFLPTEFNPSMSVLDKGMKLCENNIVFQSNLMPKLNWIFQDQRRILIV